MRRLLRRIFLKVIRIKEIRYSYYKFLFLNIESLYLNNVSVGKECVFHSPVRVSGAVGRLKIGSKNGFGYDKGPKVGNGAMLIQPRKEKSEITIGNSNLFSNNLTIIANEKIEIGSQCLIGDNVSIFDCDFHNLDPERRATGGHGPTSPVVIEDNVWLGSRVVITKGVTIGENSVVGAMSLVTNSIPPNSVAAGNPARVIRIL